jgi:hypothetical protein
MEAAVDRAPLVVGDETAADDDRAVLDDVRVAEVDLAARDADGVVDAGVAVAMRPLDREVLATKAAHERCSYDRKRRRGRDCDHGRSTTLVASRWSNMR